MLLRRWRQASDGEGQVVLLSGEPGIGKSRLVRELRERLEDEPHIRLLYQCSPHHATSPLHPVIEQLERAAGFEREDPPEARLDKLEALLARGTDRLDAGGAADRRAARRSDRRALPAPELTPQRQKQRTLEALVDQLEGLAAEQPVLLAYEDVHWIDPTTQELLELVIERVQRLPVLLLITFRPEFTPPWSGQPHVSALRSDPARPPRRCGAGGPGGRSQGPARRGRRADRGQDRRRAAVRRGADQDGAGIRICSRTRATATSFPAPCRRSRSRRRSTTP